ncbi:glycoside hydrolase family 16 protein [Sphingobacterium wenxiniae]|uniref:Glycosyl hydrolases family 16 n=1 Tax=Sphingobacterium wenxiniae TaxID=683125 RepID=A0A1I6NRF0_9SPHI|nr:glycoside hydrolase family 16 protein [Sphingobacterium wenxiniae]SFS30518.1 Glycosyl hydrolases family 16 [Sphingobacterium wenxiniae]
MKKIVNLSYTLILMGGMLWSSCSTPSQLSKGKLVWQEHFKEKGSFNQKNWSKIPRGTSDWNNYMSDEDTLYAMRDGKLILRGMANTLAPQDTAPFLTGGVYSRDKVFFGFGRWEIRAKLQDAKGAWPAFWLLPQDGKWPGGGEVDIMERLNHDDFVYQTVHSHYTHVLGINEPKKGSTGKIDPNGFNTYAVEIHPDSLVFFVNEQKTHTYPRIETDKEGQFPFKDHTFYLLLDMQLGGSWAGKVEAEELPIEMEIDWVKFYGFDQYTKGGK